MPKEGEDQNEGNRANGAVSLNIEEVSELNSKMATEKKKDTNDSRTEDGKKEDSNKSVPFYKLFVTADSLDIMLMFLGSLGSMGNGASIPLMTVLFGNLINAFGSNTEDKHKLMHDV